MLNELFLERELWDILISVVSALAYMKKRNRSHGYITLSSILTTRQPVCETVKNQTKVDIVYKIAQHDILNGTPDILLQKRNISFLSPILFR